MLAAKLSSCYGLELGIIVAMQSFHHLLILFSDESVSLLGSVTPLFPRLPSEVEFDQGSAMCLSQTLNTPLASNTPVTSQTAYTVNSSDSDACVSGRQSTKSAAAMKGTCKVMCDAWSLGCLQVRVIFRSLIYTYIHATK